MLKRIILFLSLVFCFNGYSFKYTEKNLSLSDKFRHQGYVFAGLLVGYGLTQYDVIKNEGSFSDYEDRFLEFRFDKDNSTWNLLGHPVTGSQVYLFYRSMGHTKKSSIIMGFLSSLAFEVLIETYTENPSIQDTFQTPLFGAVLGNLIENASVKLLNSNSKFNRALGRIINPFSFLVDDESSHHIGFNFSNKDRYSVNWTMRL